MTPQISRGDLGRRSKLGTTLLKLAAAGIVAAALTTAAYLALRPGVASREAAPAPVLRETSHHAAPAPHHAARHGTAARGAAHRAAASREIRSAQRVVAHERPRIHARTSTAGVSASSGAVSGPIKNQAAIYCCEGYANATYSTSMVVADGITWCANPGNEAIAAAQNAAGCRSYIYLDPTLEYPCSGCSPLYGWAASSAAVARTQSNASEGRYPCGGAPITLSAKHGIMLDPASPEVWARWDAYYTTNVPRFLDDTFGGKPYDAPGTPCDIAHWPEYQAAGVDRYSSRFSTVIYNGLQAGSGGVAASKAANAPMYALLDATTIAHKYAMFEGCYAAAGYYGLGTPGGPAPYGYWLGTEAAEIDVHAHGAAFWCYARETADNARSQSDRLFILASWLLTRASPNDVLQEQFCTQFDASGSCADGIPSGWHWASSAHNPVQPEYRFSFTPDDSSPTDISQLATGGVYHRHGYCYKGTVLIGHCEVMVNPDADAHTLAAVSGLTHTLVLSGNGIPEGGSISTTGPAPSYSLRPNTAQIALP